jgi:hypothetical protein
MTVATLVSCVSTPVQAAGAHPLEEWLATQPTEVRAAHSYRYQIHKIVQGYRSGIRDARIVMTAGQEWTPEDTEALIDKMALEGEAVPNL